MPDDKKPHIVLDNREHKLKNIFDTKTDAITYESRQLDIADIIISSEVAIERKEGSDFVSSIMDGRLFEQIVRLKDIYARPILILEGLNDGVFERTGMKKSSIYGALAVISYKYGVAVIPTRNIQDTAITIEEIAYKEQEGNKENFPSIPSAPKNMNKSERRIYIIEGLVDTGLKKAKTLIDAYKTPYNVVKAIRETEIIYTRTGNPKGIQGPLEQLSGFGWKYVKKNKKILFGSKTV
jgi:ERCC4-type nuclease